MKRIKHGLVIILLLVSAVFLAVFNVNAQKESDGERRPRIALVLSGGGARGLAHVGVIKVLEKYGIQVDYVVGTSMGSLVGGLYASGYNAASLEKIALSIDWDEYLNDSISRRELSYDEKKDDGKFMITIPFYKWEPSQVSGIIKGIKLHAFLNRLLFHVRSTNDFNALATPFACIATDIYTGEAVILNRGHLPTALRASMAIPSIFTPVEIDGHLLVDGGLVLNFPVSVAREMGADIVIGVDVGSPLYKKGERMTIPKIIDQISSFRGSESTEKQRGQCDILITPDLDGFDSTGFDRTPELIVRGEKAALQHSDELKALADRQNRFEITRRKTTEPEENEKKIYISALKVEGLKDVSRQFLNTRLQLQIPSYLTLADIEKAVIRAYGSRFFQSVTYRIDQEAGNNILVIQVDETASDFLNVGLRYDSDLKAAILINTEFKNVLGDGSRFDIEARLGENPAFTVGYMSGTGWPVGFGFGTDIWYESIDTFSYVNNDISGEYRFHNYGLDIFTCLVLFHDMELGVGLKKEFMRIDNVITMERYSESTVDYLNPYIFLRLDTIDRASFPRSGLLFNGEAMYISKALSIRKSSPASIQRYFANTEIYIPFHQRVTFLITHFLGLINGDQPPSVYYFSVGGMNTVRNIVFPFIGLHYMEATGTNIHAIGTGLQFEIFRNFLILPRYNVARIKDSTKDIISARINTVHGYGLTAGYLSILGPVSFTVSRSTSHKLHYHFNIGLMF